MPDHTTRRIRTALLTCHAVALLFFASACSERRTHFDYPQAPTSDTVDNYHGTAVADRFRPLEDPDAPETRKWIEAENEITFRFLEQIPERDAIRERLTQLWDYEKYSPPGKRGGRYFFQKNDGLQNQSVLYVIDNLRDEPRALLDPNAMSKDGTIALSGYEPSHDGKLLAYGISKAGSDWQEWHVRNVDTGEDTTDRIEWVKFSGASWSKDNTGFYYSRYDEPKKGEELQGANYFHKLYYHELGTPQSQDRLVYERPDHKDWGFGGQVSDDGRFLIIHVWKGTDVKNQLFYKDLTTPDAPVVELINEFEAEYSFIDNDGPVLWVKTDLNAPRGRIIAIDTREPARNNWQEVIPQTEHALRGAGVVGERFIASYLKDAHSLVRIHRFDGTLDREVDLPNLGTASGFSGKRGDPETSYRFMSFTDPGTIYHYNVETAETDVFRRPELPFNADDYETTQSFYTSKDGTRIPIFITHRKGLRRNGQNPTLLYGYGGFDIPITPFFRVHYLVWMEMGGVLAVANLRGGGEYGQDWHQAGMKLKKQNVFDDFIAAAEWLIDNDYTSRDKLAIHGGSNGGLLVGACMTQRPDLFGACIPSVGVMDMLRFHKFTIGWAWVSDYGSPDNPDEFAALYAYSPLHNLTPGTAYPATLILTGDHDDRVVPAHSFKFAAALQEAHSGSEPVLIRIQTQAGHGAGKPTSFQIQEAADMLAFMVKTLDADVTIGGGGAKVVRVD